MRKLLLGATAMAALSMGTGAALACDPDYTGVTLTAASQTGPYIASALQSAGEEWSKKTCGKVNVVEFPWSELYPKIVTSLSSGEETFDVISFAPAWSPDFTDYLAEVPEAMRSGAAWDDIAPIYREQLMVWNGKTLSQTIDGDVHTYTYRIDLFEDPKEKSHLLDPLPAKGMRILGVWENGFRVVTNNVRPIVKPEDLKGIKLRVPGGVWRVKMFRAYGANPTPLAYGEVFAALQSGVMDGQENPFAQIWGGKFQEVQKYLSLTNHVYTPAYLVVSERYWKSLPPDVQQVLAGNAAEVGDFARSEGARMDREILEKMRQKTKVNEVDMDAFVKASRPVYDEFGKDVPGGKDLIERIHELRRP